MILDRLHEYLLFRNISFNKFEISLGVSHGSISNAWKRKKNIGSNVVEIILLKYPEISAEWLLRGEGQMIRKINKGELNIKNETNDELISKTLQFFDLNNRNELMAYFENNAIAEDNQTLKSVILKTWEDKYGQELNIIKLQLMTLFTSKLDYEKKLEAEKQNVTAKLS